MILSFISTDLRALLAAGDQRVLAQPMQPNRNNPQIQPTQQHEVIVIGNKGGTRDQNTTNTGKGDESNTWNNNDWKNDNKNSKNAMAIKGEDQIQTMHQKLMEDGYNYIPCPL